MEYVCLCGGNPINFIDPYGLEFPSGPADGQSAKCLQQIFNVGPDVITNIDVRQRSWFASIGNSDNTTTRKDQINVSRDYTREKFFSRHYLVLHEYYHVINQWQQMI